MARTVVTSKLDSARIRNDFPALHQAVRGKGLVYLDSAASAQKPTAALDAMRRYYESDHANVRRSLHTLSVRATARYEAARETMRAFLGAESADEIVFTKGCTEALNLVASCTARGLLRPGDEIVLTHMEHHSNIVPWQMAAQQSGAKIKVLPVLDDGSLDPQAVENMLTERTKVFAFTHVSNALGTVNPVRRLVERAHHLGILTVVDGAQAAPHLRVDVRKLGADFYTVSGHKMYGPTGIGVLYGKREWLDRLPPYQGGGDMIRSVSFSGTTYADPPCKFEAGTPPIAPAIGLAATADYLTAIGFGAIEAHEADVTGYAVERLSALPGVQLIGTPEKRCGIVSFILEGVHPHDVGTILDTEGVAVRAGHHCAQPLMERFGVAATVRASFGVYNTRNDVDRLIDALDMVRRMFA